MTFALLLQTYKGLWNLQCVSAQNASVTVGLMSQEDLDLALVEMDELFQKEELQGLEQTTATLIGKLLMIRQKELMNA